MTATAAAAMAAGAREPEEWWAVGAGSAFCTVGWAAAVAAGAVVGAVVGAAGVGEALVRAGVAVCRGVAACFDAGWLAFTGGFAVLPDVARRGGVPAPEAAGWARSVSGEMAGRPWEPFVEVAPKVHRSTLPGAGCWAVGPEVA
jgi:hypothetical protein